MINSHFQRINVDAQVSLYHFLKIHLLSIYRLRKSFLTPTQLIFLTLFLYGGKIKGKTGFPIKAFGNDR